MISSRMISFQKVMVKSRQGTYCRTKKLNKEDYGVDKYWVLLAVVKK